MARSSAKLPRVEIRRTILAYDLESTLMSGQSFSWLKKENIWHGWVSGFPVEAQQIGDDLIILAPPGAEAALENYFQWAIEYPAILASFPQDEWLQEAQRYCPGLRLLRQEPWETLANFICSSLKQIVQIQQINRNLRQTFGEEIAPGLYTFPSAEILAAAGEEKLRECKLGFRAKHLARAAKQIASGEINLEFVNTLPTTEAREYLLQIAGVGEKIANCVLLFAYGRQDAFPVDVWVERVLRNLYFKGKRRVTTKRLKKFAASYFGPHAGYAQQYLFHWIRSARPKAALGQP